MKFKAFMFVGMAFILSVLLVSCGGEPTSVQTAPVATNGGTVPTPQPVPPGANGNYAANYALPAVTTVYVITGTVLAAPSSIQQYSFQGETHGSSYNGYGSVSGYISGGTTGKGFLRLKVESVDFHDPYVDNGVTKRSENWTPLVAEGNVVLLKTTDSKASALGAGDTVTFLCREQNEWVDAVAQNEIPTTSEVTRELDYCRMLSPQLTPAEPTQ